MGNADRKLRSVLGGYSLNSCFPSPSPTCLVLAKRLQFFFPPAELLRIKELPKPDYGDHVVWQPGDAPVFWPSQLTSLEAVSSCSVLGHLGTPTLA